jgi:hypothetical protein
MFGSMGSMVAIRIEKRANALSTTSRVATRVRSRPLYFRFVALFVCIYAGELVYRVHTVGPSL